MNYIFLDLEWNSSYFPKIRSSINEIIEFGAIKLDENFKEIDRFNRIVRSSLTKRLSGRFKDLTGMSNEKMLNGVPFEVALKDYKNWANDNCITLTWSNTDLYVLYDNCLYFTDSAKNAQIGLYADLQKYFHFELALLGKPEQNQISLSNAAHLFNINTNDRELHHAVKDSEISAEIFKKIFNPEHFKQFVYDTDNPFFYKRLCFKSYFINNLNDKNVDKKQLYIRCPKCNITAKRMTKFKFNNRWFFAEYCCKNCNYNFKGMISFRKLFDRVEVKKKTAAIEKENVKINHKDKIFTK